MTTQLRVLYIHPFAVYGGATKSLVEMFKALPAGQVRGTVIAPAGAEKTLAGAGMDFIRTRGISQWDDTRFGHYRGWRWLILLRELAYWPATIRALRAAADRGPYDVIHCNEVTALLAGVVAKRIVGAPLVVHVRSLQRGPANGRISTWLRGLLRERADAVVAIDEAVRRTLAADQPVTVVHNGMAAPAQTPARATGDRFCVAIIGVLHRSKGVYELIEATRMLRDRGVPVRVLVVGENVHKLNGLRGWLLRKLDFARDVRGDLELYVARHGLQDCVEFTGFISDIASIYARADAVCFPSHLDAPGRPVFEAALFARPTIVAMRNPTRDVVIDGETGLCVAAPTPTAIADAIQTLARDPDLARAMGKHARQLAMTRFDSAISAAKILSVYRSVSQSTSALVPGKERAHG